MTLTIKRDSLQPVKRLTFQNFSAGEITGTSVTLSKNQNGTNVTGGILPFAASNVENMTPIIVLQSDYETGVNDSSGNRIKVNSISGTTVTLSGVPINNVAVAIWYLYLETNPSIVKNAIEVSPDIEGNRLISLAGLDVNSINNALDTLSEVAVKVEEIDNNKTATFQSTPDDNKYPTEKLVKDNLDLKENVVNKVNAFQATPNNNKYPSEKLVKDQLDLKENISNKTSAFQATPDNDKYPTEKLVKDNLDLKVNVSDIKDNLTSTDTSKPLSALQGKTLQDNKANKDTNAVTNNVAIFDSNGNPVDGGTNLADLNDGWDGEVNTFADLPSASSNNGKKYIVKTPTGTIILGTKKYAGTYISDGTNWNIFGYKQSSVINQLLTGFTAHASVVAISATDSILAGFQKTQKYFNDFLTNFNGANQLVKLDSNGKIPAIDGSQLTNLNTSGLPVGSILPFIGSLSNIPSGFLYCNNGSYSRTTYSALFAVIGTYFGSDNSSTFKVPESRGEVLRGADNGAGRDPDASSRKKLDGSTDTDTSKAGTYQNDQNKEHKHFLMAWTGSDPTTGYSETNILATNQLSRHGYYSAWSPNSYYLRGTSDDADVGLSSTGKDSSGDDTGGDETRMRNMAVHFLIKY